MHIYICPESPGAAECSVQCTSVLTMLQAGAWYRVSSASTIASLVLRERASYLECKEMFSQISSLSVAWNIIFKLYILRIETLLLGTNLWKYRRESERTLKDEINTIIIYYKGLLFFHTFKCLIMFLKNTGYNLWNYDDLVGWEKCFHIPSTNWASQTIFTVFNHQLKLMLLCFKGWKDQTFKRIILNHLCSELSRYWGAPAAGRPCLRLAAAQSRGSKSSATWSTNVYQIFR